ncbi:protein NRT1/ PTR FAMILY 2.11 isoform X2 [Elaeis guineensis]|uniref:Protein NRT1/ PTR FAMILY 2.11 isoform X2 n=1 Tax=Elaeis guineensis var. tenera TaxID=51953 RepID=A0A6I9RAX3_ELAGV|nr:protein NRT1/ PTR FAMILY 2.11 isoform X2 [Elaeis guineensis]
MAMTGEKPREMENLENGTEAEPEIKYRGWKAMPYVIGNETFEKLGTIGTAANLLVYLTTIFHLKSVTAATTLNIFNGTTNLAPLLGAFLSDTYLGRYITLGCASVSSLLGMLILTLTAAISKLHPPKCDQGQHCIGPSPVQLAVLLCSFGLLVIGAGGIRPCNLAFGADQFNPHTESGRRGINSFFNWYYFTFTGAMMISSTFIIYIQSNVSWALGLAIPTILMFLSCTLFFLGTRLYVKVKPEGSPLTSIAQVLVVAFRKRGLKQPDDPKTSLFNPPHHSSLVSKLPYSDQFRLVDKAAIRTPMDEVKPNGDAANPWRLCSLQQVEQVKCLARIIPIWATGIILYVAIVQETTFVVFQGLQADRHFGKSKFQIPAASFTVFAMLALTIWIPVYDRILVPWLRRVTGKEGGFTLLQRMGIGIVLSVVAMIVSGLVEERRRSYALHRPALGTAPSGGAISSMSSFWLVPQLVLLGLAEAFNLIGQVEFYYKQFPENMRSLAGAVLFCGMACANYLSGFMVTVVHQTTGHNGKDNWLASDLNQGRLDYFYYLIALMGVVDFLFFIVFANWYRYKGLEDGSEIALEKSNSKSSLVSTRTE